MVQFLVCHSGLMGELYSKENCCIDRGQDQRGIIEECRVTCQVYLKCLPLLLSHVCLCLGDNHASDKRVKRALCVLLVAAVSVV